jgi:hypothetical protein
VEHAPCPAVASDTIRPNGTERTSVPVPTFGMAVKRRTMISNGIVDPVRSESPAPPAQSSARSSRLAAPGAVKTDTIARRRLTGFFSRTCRVGRILSDQQLTPRTCDEGGMTSVWAESAIETGLAGRHEFAGGMACVSASRKCTSPICRLTLVSSSCTRNGCVVLWRQPDRANGPEGKTRIGEGNRRASDGDCLRFKNPERQSEPLEPAIVRRISGEARACQKSCRSG